MVPEPAVTHRIAHVTDSHFTPSGTMHGSVQPRSNLAAALAALTGTGLDFDVLVHTGDITDDGDADAYRAVRETVEASGRLGHRVLWAAGNHDRREPLRQHLLDEVPTGLPVVGEHDVRGLRVVVLDTSVPGRVEGALESEQLDWLRERLLSPAEHGTVLALHHPPVPVEVTALQRLHLTGQRELAAVLAGSDVRGILGGHLHYATMSSIAGIPVHVAPATAYTIRLVRPQGGIVGVDGGHAAGVLSVYDDGRVGYTLVPWDAAPVVLEADEAEFAGLGVTEDRLGR